MIIDLIILIFLGFGFLIGFRRGFSRQLLSSIGLIVAFIIAFYSKNMVSSFFYENLPFFNFDGIFKGITVLNILMYEMVAFLLVLTIALVILKVLLFASKIFESILNFTIILGIPSKILGGILGFIEMYIVIFIVLFILTLPLFNLTFINNSTVKQGMIKYTPIMSRVVNKTVKAMNEFEELKEVYKTNNDKDEFNYQALDLFMKYDIIKVESAENLVAQNKLNIPNVNILINKYK